MNFTRKTERIFILTDVEAAHSIRVSFKIGNAELGIAMLSISI